MYANTNSESLQLFRKLLIKKTVLNMRALNQRDFVVLLCLNVITERIERCSNIVMSGILLLLHTDHTPPKIFSVEYNNATLSIIY